MKHLIAASLLLAAAGAAWATLGEAPSAGATRTPVAGTSYSVAERRLDSGTTVREYVDSSGAVFAVSWSGPYLPDLQQLLGQSFDALASAPASRSRSALAIDRTDVVIRSTGRMGAFEGRAWLPPRLPAGFDPKVMQ
ncbi:DUF2844 domain-containing protein [Ramlibacter humi]|uniref:DUF2844 domain-containing protein n=1 Tax=Ramlibacter humi TaxID=2530451 RepID=A0A4Z0CBA0_9BURK|nr:DUF2844 domain-containing protein [Ramlibacter humi]TFZ08611.1 DUF2844 domain-containing protein [Ramlibacter humi]